MGTQQRLVRRIVAAVMMIILVLLPTAVAGPAAAEPPSACAPADGSDAELAKCLLSPPGPLAAKWPGYVQELAMIDVITGNPQAAAMIAEWQTPLPDLNNRMLEHWTQIYGPERLQRMLQYTEAMKGTAAELTRFLFADPKVPLPEYQGEPVGTTRTIPGTPSGYTAVITDSEIDPQVAQARAEQRRKLSESEGGSWQRPLRPITQVWQWQRDYPAIYQWWAAQPNARAAWMRELLGPTAVYQAAQPRSFLLFPESSASYAITEYQPEINAPAGLMTANLPDPNFLRWPDPAIPEHAGMFAFDPVVGMVTGDDNEKPSRADKFRKVLTKIVAPMIATALLATGIGTVIGPYVASYVSTMGLTTATAAKVSAVAVTTLSGWLAGVAVNKATTGTFSWKQTLKALASAVVAGLVLSSLPESWKINTNNAEQVDLALTIRSALSTGGINTLTGVIEGRSLSEALKAGLLAAVQNGVASLVTQTMIKGLPPETAAQLRPYISKITLLTQTALFWNGEDRYGPLKVLAAELLNDWLQPQPDATGPDDAPEGRVEVGELERLEQDPKIKEELGQIKPGDKIADPMDIATAPPADYVCGENLCWRDTNPGPDPYQQCRINPQHPVCAGLSRKDDLQDVYWEMYAFGKTGVAARSISGVFQRLLRSVKENYVIFLGTDGEAKPSVKPAVQLFQRTITR